MKIKLLSTVGIITISVFLCSLLTGWINKPLGTDPAVVKQAAAKSMLLLQRSGYIFTNNNERKCASCHHNTLTALACGIARQKGVPVVDSFDTRNVAGMENTLVGACNPNQINRFINANFIIPYVLLGLNAEKYQPTIYTDISVDYIMGQAKADGSFLTESGRVPLETGEIRI